MKYLPESLCADEGIEGYWMVSAELSKCEVRLLVQLRNSCAVFGAQYSALLEQSKAESSQITCRGTSGWEDEVVVTLDVADLSLQVAQLLFKCE